jgi:hypothetical protein
MPNQIREEWREASAGFAVGYVGATMIGMIVEWISDEGVASREARGRMRICPASLL